MANVVAIAYFISPHGYGHAARACAVMAAVQKWDPAVRFEVFTRVPDWFFAESLEQPIGYHDLLTDIGLVQQDSLREDLPATLERLGQFLPFSPHLVSDIAHQVQGLGCQMVLCDVAPLGIAVARAAGIASLVVENFTWDWIYQGYVAGFPAMQPFVEMMQELYRSADYHIRTEPVCPSGAPGWSVDLVTPPVSRPARTPAHQVRGALGIPHEAKMVLVTMGGIPWEHNDWERLAQQPTVHFVFPGQERQAEPLPNVHLLPRRSGFYHPDLVNASDAVVGKLGYSTLAEAYQAGTPYGYVSRPRFPESQALAAYIQAEMRGVPIAAEQFADGHWPQSVPALLAQARLPGPAGNGAVQIADFLAAIL